MRVNVYAEEMTDNIEIISKDIDGQRFTGLRIYLHLPVTQPDGSQSQGPFIHHPGDDDSSAVTFWGKSDLRHVLRKALRELDEYYGASAAPPGRSSSLAKVCGIRQMPDGRWGCVECDVCWDTKHECAYPEFEASFASAESQTAYQRPEGDR